MGLFSGDKDIVTLAKMLNGAAPLLDPEVKRIGRSLFLGIRIVPSTMAFVYDAKRGEGWAFGLVPADPTTNEPLEDPTLAAAIGSESLHIIPAPRRDLAATARYIMSAAATIWSEVALNPHQYDPETRNKADEGLAILRSRGWPIPPSTEPPADDRTESDAQHQVTMILRASAEENAVAGYNLNAYAENHVDALSDNIGNVLSELPELELEWWYMPCVEFPLIVLEVVPSMFVAIMPRADTWAYVVMQDPVGSDSLPESHEFWRRLLRHMEEVRPLSEPRDDVEAACRAVVAFCDVYWRRIVADPPRYHQSQLAAATSNLQVWAGEGS